MRLGRSSGVVALVAAMVLPLLTPVPAAAGTDAGAADGVVDVSADARADTDPVAQPTVLLRALSGVRAGSTTVIGGGVLNDTDDAVDADLTLSDLPDGVTIAAVHPSAEASGDGPGWRCDDTSCALVDGSGDQAEVAAGDSADITLALTAPADAPAGAEVTAAFAATDPVTVALDLPDDQPARDDPAVGLSVAGPSALAPGERGAVTVRPTNLGRGDLDAGFTVTGLTPDGAASARAAGDGWACDGGSCRLGQPVPAYATGPQLTLTVVAPAREGPITASPAGTGTIAGAPVEDTDQVVIDVTDNRIADATITTRFTQPSLIAPAPQALEIDVLATGQGRLDGPIPIRAQDVDDGLALRWADAASDDDWQCDSDGCRLADGLPEGGRSQVVVPVTVDPDIAEGVAEATVRLDLPDRRPVQHGLWASEAGFAVLAPTSPELAVRAEHPDHATRPGDRLDYVAGRQRLLRIVVANHGSERAPAGETVEVTLEPEQAEPVISAGGGAWNCDDVQPADGRPLTCRRVLDRDLAPGGTVHLPVTLGSIPPGRITWRSDVGIDGAPADGRPSSFTIEALAHGPILVPDFRPSPGGRVGGRAELEVDLVNHGDRPASEQVVLLDVPPAVDVLRATGRGWTCDAGALRSVHDTLTCTRAGSIAPRDRTPALRIVFSVGAGDDDVDLWAWTDAPGQRHSAGQRDGYRYRLPVDGQITLDAGPDLTVVSPTADGEPAVVTLHGRADIGSHQHLQWRQRCTDGTDGASADSCDGASPAVTWLFQDDEDQIPTTPRAAFQVPDLDGDATTLRFRLTVTDAATPTVDDVTVRVVPPAASRVEPDRITGTGGGGGQDGVDRRPSPKPRVTLDVGRRFDVATRDRLRVEGRPRGGSGRLSYEWTQRSGPDIGLDGARTDRRVLEVTAPDLTPDESRRPIGLRLTVTDAEGRRAHADTTAVVVWGDQGIQLTVAGGAPQVAAQVDTVVPVAATAVSRGAPYTWVWEQVDGPAGLLDGAATDQPTLAITAPSDPEEATVRVTVTDDFGRTADADLPVVFTRFDPTVPPDALCRAVDDLQAGRPARITNRDGTLDLVVPPGSPPAGCDLATRIDLSGAQGSLPGGVAVDQVEGHFSIVGVRITGGRFAAPANWAPVTDLTLTSDAVVVAFDADAELGAAQAAFSADAATFLPLPGWTGGTTVSLVEVSGTVAPADPETQQIDLRARATPSSGDGQVEILGGVTAAGAVTAATRATGLARLAGVDVEMSGNITTTGPNGAVESTLGGGLTRPTPLFDGATATALTARWDPSAGYVGEGTVTIGTGPELAADVDYRPDGVGRADLASTTPWLGADLTGTLEPGPDLRASGRRDAPLAVTADLAVQEVGVTVRTDCSADPCRVRMRVAGEAQALDAAPADVSGQVDLDRGDVTLTGGVDAMTVTDGVVVRDADLEIDVADEVVATALGTAELVGADRPTTVRFETDTTVAEARLGRTEPTAGWVFRDTRLLAADADTTVTVDDTAIPVPAATLTGVGRFHLPEAYIGDGVLPDSVTSGRVSFTIDPDGDLAAATYDLSVPDPTDWYLQGGADTPVSLQVDRIGYRLEVDRDTVTAEVRGTSTLRVDDVAGPGSASRTLTFSDGVLTPDDASVLHARLVEPDGSEPWSDAFGAAGVTVSGLKIELALATEGAALSLAGTAELPAGLTGPLGLDDQVWPVAAALDGPSPCVNVELEGGVDLGNRGLVVAPSAFLAVAPGACEEPNESLDRGLSLVMAGDHLGALTVPVDPAAMTIDESVDAGDLTVGSVALRDATLRFGAGAGRWSLDLTGTGRLVGTDAEVTASMTADDPPGRWTLRATIPRLELDPALVITDADIALTTDAVFGPSEGPVDISVTGTTSLLGVPVPVDLDGQLISGQVRRLQGTVAERTYQLPEGDELTAAFTIVHDHDKAPALAIRAVGARLVTTGYEGDLVWPMTGAVVEIDRPGSFTVEVDDALPADGHETATLTGRYHVTAPDGGQAGDFTLATPSDVHVALAGLSTTMQMTVGREGGTTGAETEIATSLGLTDEGEPIETTATHGPDLRPTFTLTDDDVPIRALRGDLTVTVAPVGRTTVRPLAPSSEASGDGAGLATATTTFVVPRGACAFWKGRTTFTGALVRSHGATVYDLSADVDPVLPGGLEGLGKGANVARLTNVSVAPIEHDHGEADGSFSIAGHVIAGDGDGEQDPLHLGHTLTVNLGISMPGFAGGISFAYAPASCGFAVRGYVQFSTGGATAPSGLWKSLSSVLNGSGAEEDLTDLVGGESEFGVGAVLSLVSTHELHHRLEHQADRARTRARDASDAADRAQNEADAARAQFDAAVARARATADQELTEIIARSAVDVEASTDQAESALRDAEADEQASQRAKRKVVEDPKQITISLGWTHCTTCGLDRIQLEASVRAPWGPVDITIGLEIHLDLATEDRTTSVEGVGGALSGAVGKYFHEGLSIGPVSVGVTADAEVKLTLGVEWHAAKPFELEIELAAEAGVAVFADFVVWKAKATLASVELAGSVRLFPWSPLFKFHARLYVLGLTVGFRAEYQT